MTSQPHQPTCFGGCVLPAGEPLPRFPAPRSTNASYARWLDARKAWGKLINRSRDLTRQASFVGLPLPGFQCCNLAWCGQPGLAWASVAPLQQHARAVAISCWPSTSSSSVTGDHLHATRGQAAAGPAVPVDHGLQAGVTCLQLCVSSFLSCGSAGRWGRGSEGVARCSILKHRRGRVLSCI